MRNLEFSGHRAGRTALVLAALATTLAAAGCSGTSSSFGERFNQAAASGNAAQASAATPQSTTVSYCPTVDVRPGTSSLAFNAPGVEGALALRYQATVAQTARECSNVGGNLNIKVGVQGRIILGPAGGPGVIEVPLRLALVHEGPNPKTIWTKLHRIPVTISDGAPHVTFTHVEEELNVPMPGGADIEAYVIYVGFDPLGAKPQPDKKQPQRKRTQPTG